MQVELDILGLLIFAAVGLAFAAKPIARYIIKRVINSAMKKLLSDTYDQNLAELLPSIKRFSVLNLIELSLRAERGKIITRPLGSPRQFPGFDMLMFSPRQLTSLSLSEDVEIDMSVTIGHTAEKPLTINIPLMIGGMAYGIGLSKQAKIALATAASAVQTAANSGEGPFLAEEAEAANKFVLQICSWKWGSRTDEQIATADMLEIKIGQGAEVGTSIIEAQELVGRARELAGLEPGENAVSLTAPPGISSPADWSKYLKDLRQRANGIPIAIKIMATDHLEEELTVAESLGCNAVVICGCGGGAHAVPPLKDDDFGIPILYALNRARRFLKNSRMSLIVSGGFFTPGQCLKALALGADAIYLGTAPLFALGHNQLDKVLPWEPPTTLTYYNSDAKSKLDTEQAAVSVANLLQSMVKEMKDAMRALGKTSLRELRPDDLAALDAFTAEITGLRRAYDPSSIYIPAPMHQPQATDDDISDDLTAEETTLCQALLTRLHEQLRFARRVQLLTETVARELRETKNLPQARRLRFDYNSLITHRSDLDRLN